MVQYIPYSCIEKFNIVKMSILSKLTYNVIPIKTTNKYFYMKIQRVKNRPHCLLNSAIL